MNIGPAGDCPEPIRLAFLDLLTWTLIQIRNEPADAALCRAPADHSHNVPALLSAYRPRLLRYYWEVERPCFLEALRAIDRNVPNAFDQLWKVVESEYHQLDQPPSP
ncbi:hypothetical protein [Paludisphaera mucosa]|uniref:Uncharacterized protein n=1 Tax=Paludisphaera mucosa TaxID=3030827 RepID=A0ABT6FEE8_9BACT|nr:hypothetical protein [Paludisphaera mucosa]MDG3005758.1 hypothetical protein [Paludisphaera mucosa]